MKDHQQPEPLPTLPELLQFLDVHFHYFTRMGMGTSAFLKHPTRGLVNDWHTFLNCQERGCAEADIEHAVARSLSLSRAIFMTGVAGLIVFAGAGIATSSWKAAGIGVAIFILCWLLSRVSFMLQCIHRSWKTHCPAIQRLSQEIQVGGRRAFFVKMLDERTQDIVQRLTGQESSYQTALLEFERRHGPSIDNDRRETISMQDVWDGLRAAGLKGSARHSALVPHVGLLRHHIENVLPEKFSRLIYLMGQQLVTYDQLAQAQGASHEAMEAAYSALETTHLELHISIADLRQLVDEIVCVFEAGMNANG